MKKMLPLSIILLLFLLLLPKSAFADAGTFTASNVHYNPDTYELSFDADNFSGSINGYGDPFIEKSGTFEDNSFTRGRATGDAVPLESSHHYDYILDNVSYWTWNPQNGDSLYIGMSGFQDGTFLGRWDSQDLNYADIVSTPTPTPAVKIEANPSSSNVTVGIPFNVDVKVTDTGSAFNAVQATVTASSNLSVTGIHAPSSNACTLQYTKHPKPSDPSFAGAIFGSFSTGCTVYTMTLTPNATGTGTVTFTNGSVKAYADNSEILTGVQNGSFTIADGPTPTPTAGVPQLTITSPLLTYLTNYTLAGGKDAAITHVFINDSESGVTFPTSTTWQKSETLSLGDNTFTIYGSDDDSNQTATQTVDVNRHALGDINGDGNVDLIDASLFAVDFGKTSNLTYILSDMNNDGNADLTDLSVLAKLEE